MKNCCKVLIIAFILIGGLLIVIKLSQRNALPASLQSLTHQDMFTENQDLINRVITLCENDDDIDTFATKAWSILEDQTKWSQQYADILKQKPELANKVDEQWMEVIYTFGSSLDNDSNKLRKQKKGLAMEMIGKNIKPETLINYLKNKPNIKQII